MLANERAQVVRPPRDPQMRFVRNTDREPVGTWPREMRMRGEPRNAKLKVSHDHESGRAGRRDLLGYALQAGDRVALTSRPYWAGRQSFIAGQPVDVRAAPPWPRPERGRPAAVYLFYHRRRGWQGLKNEARSGESHAQIRTPEARRSWGAAPKTWMDSDRERSRVELRLEGRSASANLKESTRFKESRWLIWSSRCPCSSRY